MNASEFFIFGFDGTSLPQKVSTFIRKNPIGGVILFRRNIETLEQVVSLNSEIINCQIAHPCIISVDQEGGSVARLRGITTDLPHMALLEPWIDSPEKLFRVGAMLGRELAVLGFNLNFAPVCDVRANDNPLIKDRSFSSNPHTVADLATEFIRGLQASGVAACAKHFPGHGQTLLDSHFTLPTVNASLNQLHEQDLVPFAKAIKNNVATIMTAHIDYPEIDRLIATLSPKIMHDLLRNLMGFTGLLISDDLDMKAIKDRHTLEETLVLGIEAGIDQFIIGNDFEKTMEAASILENALTRSPSLTAQAQKSRDRIIAHKSRYVGTMKAPDINDARKIVRSGPHLDLVASLV